MRTEQVSPRFRGTQPQLVAFTVCFSSLLLLAQCRGSSSTVVPGPTPPPTVRPVITADWKSHFVHRSMPLTYLETNPEPTIPWRRLGDVDGDGVDDFGVLRRRPSPGKIEIHSGRSGAVVRTLTPPTGAVFGYQFAGPGDLDDDGIADVLISASPPGRGRPALHAFSGRTLALLYTVETTFVFNPIDFSEAFGTGDINGDGYSDFALSYDASGRTPGFVSLFSGLNGAALGGVTGRSEFRTWPTGSQSFGRSFVGGADLDGDGHADFAAGELSSAFVSSTSPVFPGTVYVFSGSSTQLIRKIEGGIRTEFGAAVDFIADVDGDGRADIAVGEPKAGRGGKVHVFSSADSRLLATIEGSTDQQLFGSVVRGIADVDGDGAADLLVGAPGAGRIALVSIRKAAILQEFAGTTAGFGKAASVVGDVNGDGAADYLVGTGTELLTMSTRKLFLATDRYEVSLASGGAQEMSLDAGAVGAGQQYFVAGSLGISPGFRLGAVQVPLNPDPWFDFTIRNANTATFVDTSGGLSTDGRASARIVIPTGLLPSLVGTTVFHAFVVYEGRANYLAASNAAPLTLVR